MRKGVQEGRGGGGGGWFIKKKKKTPQNKNQKTKNK